MKQITDCFFIGYNETRFSQLEKRLRLMGTQSGAYQDQNLDFIMHKDAPYSISEIYNLFRYDNINYMDDSGLLNQGNVFSATIAYLGTYLNSRGFKFDYVNTFQDEKEYLKKRLIENNIRLIAIPTTFYVAAQPIIEIITFIKKYNNSAKIVLGGPLISSITRSLDENSFLYMFKSINADFYISSSQGETALINILHNLRDGLPVESINNIFYKQGSKYVGNQVVVEDNKLEENMVDWGLFKDRLGKFASTRTSISCPFSCSYCEYPQHAGKYQTVSIEAIERELDSIENTGKVRSVGFIDDTFNVPPQRFKDILKLIIKNKYQFKWHSFFRCQFADNETVELMKESGCEGVYLGIESGSQEILENMNKNVTVDQYKRGIELLKKHNISFQTSFLIGFPGETENTVEETINFIKECEPPFFNMHLWYCSLLTPISQQKDKYNIKGSQFDWSHETMNANTACNHIYRIFNMSLKNSVYIPQYHFDFLGLFNLMHRGMNLEQIKTFLNCFNAGVKEKLSNPTHKNISTETEEKMKNACCFDI